MPDVISTPFINLVSLYRILCTPSCPEYSCQLEFPWELEPSIKGSIQISETTEGIGLTRNHNQLIPFHCWKRKRGRSILMDMPQDIGQTVSSLQLVCGKSVVVCSHSQKRSRRRIKITCQLKVTKRISETKPRNFCGFSVRHRDMSLHDAAKMIAYRMP